MSSELNYPIRYAIVPIYKVGKYDLSGNYPKRIYEVDYYMLSVCYLIDEIRSYKKDGVIETKYNVLPIIPNRLSRKRMNADFEYETDIYTVNSIYTENELAEANTIVSNLNNELSLKSYGIDNITKKLINIKKNEKN